MWSNDNRTFSEQRERTIFHLWITRSTPIQCSLADRIHQSTRYRAEIRQRNRTTVRLNGLENPSLCRRDECESIASNEFSLDISSIDWLGYHGSADRQVCLRCVHVIDRYWNRCVNICGVQWKHESRINIHALARTRCVLEAKEENPSNWTAFMSNTDQNKQIQIWDYLPSISIFKYARQDNKLMDSELKTPRRFPTACLSLSLPH